MVKVACTATVLAGTRNVALATGPRAPERRHASPLPRRRTRTPRRARDPWSVRRTLETPPTTRRALSRHPDDRTIGPSVRPMPPCRAHLLRPLHAPLGSRVATSLCSLASKLSVAHAYKRGGHASRAVKRPLIRGD
jgi:hypothetical protein